MTAPSISLDALRQLIQDKVIPASAESDRTSVIPLAVYQELHQLGWWTCSLPQEVGGGGLSPSDLCHVSKIIGYGSAGIATSYAANLAAMVAISQSHHTQFKQALLGKMVGEFSFSSFCFTEPDSGSDVLSIKTTAEKVSGGYRLTGHKCFITNANYAQHLVVLAKIKGAPDPKQSLTAFYVSRDMEGVSTGKPLKKMGLRDSNTGEIFLDHVFVSDENKLGQEGEGLKIASQALKKSRTLLASSAMGLCERAGDLVQNHLEKRILYSKPLIEQPAIRCFLAQLHTEKSAAWYLALAASQTWEQPMSSLELSSMAKLFAGQVVNRFVKGAMELYGGWGYTEEFEINRLYRNAQVYETLEGPSLVQQTIIAKELFPKKIPDHQFKSVA